MVYKKLKSTILAAGLAAALVCTGCGGDNGSGGDASSASSAAETGTEAASADSGTAEGDSSDAEAKENTESEGTESETTAAEEVSYDIYMDSSNEKIESHVVGAELVERGSYKYLRVYELRTNLTDKLLDADAGFTAYQDENQVYVQNHGRDYLEEFASEEGIMDDETKLQAYDIIYTRGRYLMPGVTKMRITDIRLNSDSPVNISYNGGEITDSIDLDLNDLPGAPASLKTTETVEDPEIWKDAVVNYADEGTVNIRRTGDVGFKFDDVSLIDDPSALSPSGKLIQVTVTMTNNTEKELNGEETVDKWDAILVIQDGVNLQNIYDKSTSPKTVIAPGESAQLTVCFQPILDNSVFVAAKGAALSATTGAADKSDNFGMVYTLE